MRLASNGVPAVAALITAALDGPHARRDLLERVSLWRVPVHWYIAALLVPFAVTVIRTIAETWLGVAGPVRFQAFTPLALVVFVMVFGEEVGWRGFAMPRLHRRYDSWRSSTIIGVLWALWHLPLFFMVGMPQYQHPFLPYVGYLIALSSLLAWVTRAARGSVIVATTFHGAVNTFGIVNAGATPSVRGWTNFISYALVAIIVGIVSGSIGRQPEG